MKPHGTYKIAHRRNPIGPGLTPHPARVQSAYDPLHDPILGGSSRFLRLLESLRDQITDGGERASVRVRQVFREPKEIFRLEIDLPELGYQRTTLLERDALEELLEIDEVRAIIRSSTFDSSSSAQVGGE